MANNVYLVLSERPDAVGDAEYHRWYTDHAQENIESVGFVSAQRYRVRQVANGVPVGFEKHLALYEYAGDMSIWRTDLSSRIAKGEITLPPWFGQIGFTSWACEPEGGLLQPRTHD